ncbi:MAG: hypothetical protein KDA86_18875, partial [Planctomycetaceae bacterium]|nr:hypothetical protein [Planctomycetaceae bacterium]
LCPYPRHRSGTSTGDHRETHCRKRRRTRRQQRAEFFSRPFAQKLIRRRGTRVEPFNDWLKTRFDLHDRIWHRGLNNNRPQLLVPSSPINCSCSTTTRATTTTLNSNRSSTPAEFPDTR